MCPAAPITKQGSSGRPDTPLVPAALELLGQVRRRTSDPARLAVVGEYELAIGRLGETLDWPVFDVVNAVRLLARRWGVGLAGATSAAPVAAIPDISLSTAEAALFAQAARSGVLSIPPLTSP